jgi:hypothetical protein
MGRGASAGELGDNLPPVNLGTGRTVTEASCGLRHCCAVVDTLRIKCWGENFNVGTLGLGDSVNRRATPGTMGDLLPDTRIFE